MYVCMYLPKHGHLLLERSVERVECVGEVLDVAEFRLHDHPLERPVPDLHGAVDHLGEQRPDYDAIDV